MIFVDSHNRNLPTKISHQGSYLRVDFTPVEVGPHIMNVLYNGQPVGGSPYTCYCYDASRVRIIDVTQTGKINEEMGFTG